MKTLILLLQIAFGLLLLGITVGAFILLGFVLFG